MYIHTYRFTNPSGCHCDDGCCIKTPSAPPGTDCSIYNTIGSRKCNSNKGCQWICDCKNITDPNVCTRSTCLAQPNLACNFSSTTRCSCPSCCQDHPDKNNNFNCASLHMAGTNKCNDAVDGRTCQWTCPCSDIDNKDTCVSSTCTNNPSMMCTYDEDSCFC